MRDPKLLCLLVITCFFPLPTNETQGQAPGDQDRLYTCDRVTQIEITIDEESWNKLRLQKRDFVDSMIDPDNKPFDTFHADLRIDGVEIKDVGIRKKGFLGSLDDDFPSLRIKLDEYVEQSPMGIPKRLTLNNNKQDTSLLSQYMTYRFFNQVGVEAPRVGFAAVAVNGKDLGIYSLVEPIEKAFLKSRYGTSAGDLWEGTLSDFSPKSVRRLEWKSGKNESVDQWKVMRLAEVLQSEPFDENALSELVDLDQFYRFWAAESLLAFWDGYCNNQNNYFLYDNPKSGKLVFIPWGADALWSSMAGPFGGFRRIPQSVYTNGALAYRLLKSERGKSKYREIMQGLLDEHWNEEELQKEIDDRAALLAPYLHKRQSGAASAQKSMKRFIQTRRKHVSKELEEWPIEIPDQSRRPMYINEIGNGQGEFSTFWERVPEEEKSTGKFELHIEGEDIEFLDPKISARRFSFGMFGMGQPQKAMPPMVELIGKSKSGVQYTLSIIFGLDDFDKENLESNIRGTLADGSVGGAGPWGSGNVKWVQGVSRLQHASTKSGAEIKGQFDIKLLEIKGGFFER